MELTQSSNEKSILTQALSEFFNINIDESKIEANALNHYSYSKESISLDRFAIAGNSLLPLISSHFAISLEKIKEEEISISANAIKKYIISKLLERLTTSKVYILINFGGGVTDSEKKSPTTLLGLLEIIIGIAIKAGYFFEIYWQIASEFLNHTIPVSKDNKTTLQEITQKNNIRIPTYEVISTEGPDHDKAFAVECSLSNGLKTIGRGRSKKFAESNAAAEMIRINFADQPPKTITLPKLSLDIYKKNLQSGEYYNKDICENFNLAKEINLNPCFIPPRFKRTGGWGGRSHRALAILGSNALDLLISLFCFEQVRSSPSEAKKIKAEIGRRTLKTSELASIMNNGNIWPSNIPYRHNEIDNSEEYSSDCIQSLFAISFIRAANSRKILDFLSSPAANLIQRKVKSQPSDIKHLHENFSSMASERYSKIGFCYEFKKLEEHSIGVKITHLKSGNEHIHFFEPNKHTSRENRLSASRAMLRLIDASEGLLPVNEIEKADFSALEKLSEFLFSNMTHDRKASSPNDILDEIRIETSKHTPEYHDLSTSELATAWANREKLSISQQSEILARLRALTKVDQKVRPIETLSFIPVVYDSFYYSHLAKSIVDYDDTQQKYETEHNPTEEPHQTTIEHHSEDNNSNTIKKPQKLNIISYTKPDEVIISAREQLQKIETRLSSMSISALESLWSERETVLDSTEEAAILLSVIRFEKGIDFHKVSYNHLMNIDAIKSLELPSIFSTATPSNPTPKEQFQIASAKEFILDKRDRRTKKISSTTIRTGQSNFRSKVLSNYKHCCITGCTVTEVIEAAHIAPYRGEKDNHIKNGLLLRTDIHRLFDSNKIGISPNNFEIHISEHLRGTEYEQYAGNKISHGTVATPANSAIEYRWEYFCECNNIRI
uniref:putative dsRNA-binding protein n=1 Tax=Pseudomonas laurentiana TaxID=2364649 RepID=UPI0029C731FB|nr:putative dsRNA-binding protein [Pseudomonas laurentiana]